VGATVAGGGFLSASVGTWISNRPSPSAYPAGGFEQSVLYSAVFVVVGTIVSGFIGYAVGAAIGGRGKSS
jgi:hypothetical protein